MQTDEWRKNEMVTAVATSNLGFIILLFGFFSSSYAQTIGNTTAIALDADPLVYHLSSSDPWRASIVVSDANTIRIWVTMLLCY